MGVNKLVAFSCMSLTLACAAPARADDFQSMQFVTYDQTDWGSGGTASSVLSADYDTVFAPSSQLIVGVVGVPNQYYLVFTDSGSVLRYLPASGTSGPLTASITNPTTTSSGIFGGDVVALDLNIAFNNAGLLGSTSSTPFGDLVLTDLAGFASADSAFDGLTVSEFLSIANTCLSGGSCPYALDNVDALTQELNFSFEDGTPDSWADDYLALPSSVTPTTAPEPSSLLLLAPALASLGLFRRARKHYDRSPPSPASGLSSAGPGQGNPRFPTGGLPWA